MFFRSLKPLEWPQISFLKFHISSFVSRPIVYFVNHLLALSFDYIYTTWALCISQFQRCTSPRDLSGICSRFKPGVADLPTPGHLTSLSGFGLVCNIWILKLSKMITSVKIFYDFGRLLDTDHAFSVFRYLTIN